MIHHGKRWIFSRNLTRKDAGCPGTIGSICEIRSESKKYCRHEIVYKSEGCKIISGPCGLWHKQPHDPACLSDHYRLIAPILKEMRGWHCHQEYLRDGASISRSLNTTLIGKGYIFDPIHPQKKQRLEIKNMHCFQWITFSVTSWMDSAWMIWSELNSHMTLRVFFSITSNIFFSFGWRFDRYFVTKHNIWWGMAIFFCGRKYKPCGQRIAIGKKCRVSHYWVRGRIIKSIDQYNFSIYIWENE